MMIFLFFLLKILLGFSLVQSLWPERQLWPIMLKICVAVPLGMGISSLLFFCWRWLSLPGWIYPWFEILLSVVSLLVLIWKTGSPLPKAGLVVSSDWLGKTLLFSALLSALVGVTFFVIYSVNFQHGFFEDAWFIWNLTARFLYRAADWTVIFGPTNLQSVLWHPDYPLLLSLSVVQGWLINGGETTLVPILVAGLFTFSIPGMLFAALMVLKDFKQAALGLVLLLTTPWFVMHGAEQVADVPISAYYLGATVFILLFLRQRNPLFAVLSGLLAGLSAWTKNEGLYFWLNFVLVWVLVAVWLDKKPRAIWSFLSGSLFPIGIVILFKVFLAPGSDLFQQTTPLLAKLTDLSRYALIFTEFGHYISGFGGWPLGIFWVLLVYALVIGLDRHDWRELVVITLIPIIQLAGYFSIYLITPHDLDWHLTTSLGRLLTQIFPFTLLLLMVALKSPAGLTESNQAGVQPGQ